MRSLRGIVLGLGVSVGCAAPEPRPPSRAVEVATVAPAPVADAGESPGAQVVASDAALAGDVGGERGAGPSSLVAEAPSRHRSPLLEGEPRASRLKPGTYPCRVGAEYRLRPCTVTKDERGFTWLEAPQALLHLKGVIYDEGKNLVFDGATAEERPFGCFSCQERCSLDPSSCSCVELPVDASRECLARPITVRLAPTASGFAGMLEYHTYGNRYEGQGDARHVAGWDTTRLRLLVEIVGKPAVAAGKARSSASDMRDP